MLCGHLAGSVDGEGHNLQGRQVLGVDPESVGEHMEAAVARSIGDAGDVANSGALGAMAGGGGDLSKGGDGLAREQITESVGGVDGRPHGSGAARQSVRSGVHGLPAPKGVALIRRVAAG